MLGGAAVIGAFSMLGVSCTNKMKKRIDFLESFWYDVILLKTKISERCLLARSLKYVGMFSRYGFFWNDWAGFAENHGIMAACEKTIEKNRSKCFMKDSDIKNIRLLANVLGKTDIDAQLEHIDYISSALEYSCNAAVKEYEKNSGLYRNGCILLGIFTFILLA